MCFKSCHVGDDLASHLAQLVKQLHAERPHFIRQIVAASDSLLVEYDINSNLAPIDLERWALQQLQQPLLQVSTSRHWSIAVDYSGEDLGSVAQQLNLTPQQVISLHSQVRYQVVSLGFAPGFAYLGYLPPALRLPRRARPRARVCAGSVAIAETMTAIYPSDSPGGWHIIGYTNQQIFDWQQQPPGSMQAGDQVSFYAQTHC